MCYCSSNELYSIGLLVAGSRGDRTVTASVSRQSKASSKKEAKPIYQVVHSVGTHTDEDSAELIAESCVDPLELCCR